MFFFQTLRHDINFAKVPRRIFSSKYYRMHILYWTLVDQRIQSYPLLIYRTNVSFIKLTVIRGSIKLYYICRCRRGLNPELLQYASSVFCPCELTVICEMSLPLNLASRLIDCNGIDNEPEMYILCLNLPPFLMWDTGRSEKSSGFLTSASYIVS